MALRIFLVFIAFLLVSFRTSFFVNSSQQLESTQVFPTQGLTIRNKLPSIGNICQTQNLDVAYGNQSRHDSRKPKKNLFTKLEFQRKKIAAILPANPKYSVTSPALRQETLSIGVMALLAFLAGIGVSLMFYNIWPFIIGAVLTIVLGVFAIASPKKAKKPVPELSPKQERDKEINNFVLISMGIVVGVLIIGSLLFALLHSDP